ncbi:MAG: hypothetical protein GXX93_13800 [Anaerolineae bacterium]|nr:hypothetical protein [Anaerolineae bacterium]
MSRARSLALALGLLALVAVGCAPAAPPEPGLVQTLPPTATPRSTDSSPESVVAGLVLAEGEAVRQQDIDVLAGLWLPDSTLVDASHTPAEPGDDRRWEGWDAIRDRYVLEVFPNYRAPEAGPRPRQSLPVVSLEADTAVVTVAGSDGQTIQDRWTLQRVDGQWRIAGLEYNLAPVFAPPAGG